MRACARRVRPENKGEAAPSTFVRIRTKADWNRRTSSHTYATVSNVISAKVLKTIHEGNRYFSILSIHAWNLFITTSESYVRHIFQGSLSYVYFSFSFLFFFSLSLSLDWSPPLFVSPPLLSPPEVSPRVGLCFAATFLVACAFPKTPWPDLRRHCGRATRTSVSRTARTPGDTGAGAGAWTACTQLLHRGSVVVVAVGTRGRGLERHRCAQVLTTRSPPVSLVTVAEWTVARARRRT